MIEALLGGFFIIFGTILGFHLSQKQIRNADRKEIENLKILLSDELKVAFRLFRIPITFDKKHNSFRILERLSRASIYPALQDFETNIYDTFLIKISMLDKNEFKLINGAYQIINRLKKVGRKDIKEITEKEWRDALNWFLTGFNRTKKALEIQRDGSKFVREIEDSIKKGEI